jgi:tRNA nucleotidyltransferase/poly(A) polymerase
MAPLINNVPAARLFDEMLKLLTSGHAMACLQELRSEGLHHGILPLLDVVMEQPMGEKFVNLALANTDDRVQQGKPFHRVSCLPRCCGIRCWKNGKPIKLPENFRFRHCIWPLMMC